ncbi:MFS transporter [Lentzea sp. NPDC051213]|uniref:MFS transporter n=1 Tax=Lentzea sp. NPDC051213 TaxID=3364126 RepID=UPI00378D089B
MRRPTAPLPPNSRTPPPRFPRHPRHPAAERIPATRQRPIHHPSAPRHPSAARPPHQLAQPATKPHPRRPQRAKPATQAHPVAMARLLTPRFALLTAADLGYFTAMGIAVYALPLYVTGPLRSSEGAAGLAFGAFAISALLLRPFAGRLTDRIGRRPLLVGGTALAAVSLALTALATDLPTIIALRLLLGVAEAAFFVAGFAALADIAPPDRLGEALSLNSLGLYLGLAFGPPLGEVLAQRSFPTAWLTAAALCAAGTVAVVLLGETSETSETGTPSDTKKPQLIHRASIRPAIGLCAALAASGGFLAFAALRAQESGFENTSLPLFLYGATVVACRAVFAKVPDRVPPLTLGAAALAVIATGLVLTATPHALIAGSVVLAVGVTFSTPAFFAAVFATAEPHQRGAAAGTASAFIDIGLGGGPMLLGLVANVSIPAALATAGGLAALGCLWTLNLRRAH